MNTLVKLHLMAKANGRSVKDEMEAIVESAFQVHSLKIDHRPELAAMKSNVSTGVGVPSNPALAFSQVKTARVHEPVSINPPRRSPRRPHNHG